MHKSIVVSNIKFENQANVSNSGSGSSITKLPSWKFLDSQYTAASRNSGAGNKFDTKRSKSTWKREQRFSINPVITFLHWAGATSPLR